MPSFAGAGARLMKESRRLLDREIQTPNAGKRVAIHLRDRLEAMAQGGQIPIYQMFVDNKETKELTSVTFRGSVIEIQFELLDGVAIAMLDYAKTISARKSGDYMDAWVLLVDGVPWTDYSRKIPHNSVVILTNYAPYARRLEELRRFGRSGRLASYARPEMVVTERTRQWAQRQFPGALIERQFIVLPGGGMARGWEVPYTLRRGRHKGDTITYPALKVTER
jgi:hypothetical protein